MLVKHQTADLVNHNMRLFLAVILLITLSSGESPAVHISLTDKALQYGKVAA